MWLQDKQSNMLFSVGRNDEEYMFNYSDIRQEVDILRRLERLEKFICLSPLPQVFQGHSPWIYSRYCLQRLTWEGVVWWRRKWVVRWRRKWVVSSSRWDCWNYETPSDISSHDSVLCSGKRWRQGCVIPRPGSLWPWSEFTQPRLPPLNWVLYIN